MAGTAYYNEIDPAAAHILRSLIDAGVLAPGDVDTRSIKEVMPDDLAGYTQCHFFAGGGLWSVAARLAGWPDDRPLWTGSCPCQGESLAGKRLGADDPRHLWPDFHRLIRARRPPVVMGEQVAAAAGTHWLDRVCADLEDEDYASRAVDIPACAVDGPHQRQRLYWIAVDYGFRDGQLPSEQTLRTGRKPSDNADEHSILIDAASLRRGEGRAEHEFRGGRAEDAERSAEERAAVERSADILPNGSWWSGAEWIISPIDGKARRTKPGIPFLVDGLPGRVDLWRVGGNAISPILAAEVIAAYLDAERDDAAALQQRTAQ